MNAHGPRRLISLLIVFPMMLTAQLTRQHDPTRLTNWPAPLYWQPSQTERGTPNAALTTITPQAATTNLPLGTNALVFVAMTPCRVMDTRTNQGFLGAFGPPSIVAGYPVRTIPIQSSTACSIPSVAQAYSLNVTVVPPGPLLWVTLYPATSGTQPNSPNASTLNDPAGTIVANAAVVPAGTDGQGSVDVYASNTTDLIIDINGYYAPPGDLNGNTALGAGTLANNTGSFNTAAGAGALENNTAGSGSTGIGFKALLANTTGTSNTAVGANALMANTTGDNNTATGADSLLANTTGAANTANGFGALQNNTTGNDNTAIGDDALADNSTGVSNTATGAFALLANTTGSQNTATGTGALQNTNTGNSNTASGWAAMYHNTTGNGNTANGVLALYFNTTGQNNTAIGNGVLYSSTTASYNTAIGLNALSYNTTGNLNTASGVDTLFFNTTGSNNIAIGWQAAINVSGGNSNNIHIGTQGASTDANAIRIGGNLAFGDIATQNRFFAAGIRGVTTGNNDAVPVVIDSNGQLGTVSSSRRFKEDIHDMGDASSGLLRLRPATFRYRHPFADGSKPIQYGLIAEEVAEIYPDLVAHSADGQIETVKYQVLDSMLLNELQKEHLQVQKQLEIIQRLEARLAALEEILQSHK